MVCVCLSLQMSSRKKTIAKRSAKHLRYDNQRFRNGDDDSAFIEFYNEAVIIVEREVNLESLSYTFILEVFGDKVWGPFLIGFGIVCDSLIQEFLSNAIMEGDHLN